MVGCCRDALRKSKSSLNCSMLSFCSMASNWKPKWWMRKRRNHCISFVCCCKVSYFVFRRRSIDLREDWDTGQTLPLPPDTKRFRRSKETSLNMSQKQCHIVHRWSTWSDAFIHRQTCNFLERDENDRQDTVDHMGRNWCLLLEKTKDRSIDLIVKIILDQHRAIDH